MNDPHVAPDEDELLRDLVRVREETAELLLHDDAPLILCHIRPLLARVCALLALSSLLTSIPPQLYRLHQRSASEETCFADAPLPRDTLDGREIKRHEALPELRILALERAAEAHVQAVIEEDELGATGVRRVRAHEDVARVRVAVDPAPVEDLRTEELDHRVHDPRDAALQRAPHSGSALGVGGRDLRGDVSGRTLAHQCADGAAIGKPDSVNPLGDHDFLGGEVGVNLGDVHLVGEMWLLGDEVGSLPCILRFELKVELTPKVVTDEVCKLLVYAQKRTAE